MGAPYCTLACIHAMKQWNLYFMAWFWCFSFTLCSLPCGPVVKVSACNVGDSGSIPGWGRSPRVGNGYPLQYSCLENFMDRGAWWTTVHGVPKSWTGLSCWVSHFTSLVIKSCTVHEGDMRQLNSTSILLPKSFALFIALWVWGRVSGCVPKRGTPEGEGRRRVVKQVSASLSLSLLCKTKFLMLV